MLSSDLSREPGMHLVYIHMHRQTLRHIKLFKNLKLTKSYAKKV